MTDGAGNKSQLLGFALLRDLETMLGNGQIAGFLEDYAALTGYDSRFQHLYHATGGRVDLAHETHRVAMVNWLRAWGCRHLRRVDPYETGDVVRAWWEKWGAELPGPGTSVTGLDVDVLSAVEQAYDALRTERAAGVPVGDQRVDVVFGDTAAAKTLFAMRPAAFLPWDEPIRLAFGWWGGGAAYVELLRLAASTLGGLSARLNVPVGELPELLGRPQSSPPKLVDEYLWVRVTKST